MCVETPDPGGQPDLRVMPPRDGLTLCLGARVTPVPSSMTAAAPVDLDHVEYSLDGVPFGMAARAPYAVMTLRDRPGPSGTASHPR